MRFFFHIGAGKTGSSSIQRTLFNSEVELREQGVKYLGLMLEHSPIRIFDWQDISALDKFSSLDSADAEKQVDKVLKLTIEHYKNSNIHTLIWSHEWFFSVMVRRLPRLNPLG